MLLIKQSFELWLNLWDRAKRNSTYKNSWLVFPWLLKEKEKENNFFRGMHCFHWARTGPVWQYWSNGRGLNLVHSNGCNAVSILVTLNNVWHIDGHLCFIKGMKLFSNRDRSATEFHNFSAHFFARYGTVRTVFGFQLLQLGMDSHILWCNSIYSHIKLDYLFKIGRNTFFVFFYSVFWHNSIFFTIYL